MVIRVKKQGNQTLAGRILNYNGNDEYIKFDKKVAEQLKAAYDNDPNPFNGQKIAIGRTLSKGEDPVNSMIGNLMEALALKVKKQLTPSSGNQLSSSNAGIETEILDTFNINVSELQQGQNIATQIMDRFDDAFKEFCQNYKDEVEANELHRKSMVELYDSTGQTDSRCVDPQMFEMLFP